MLRFVPRTLAVLAAATAAVAATLPPLHARADGAHASPWPANNTWGAQGGAPRANVTAAHPEGLANTDQLLQTGNLAARFWRIAQTRDPSAGHPQYTFGGYGNTPPKPRADVGTYTMFDATEWTSGFFSAGLWALYDRLTQCRAAGNVSGAPELNAWAAQATNWTSTLAVNAHTNVHDLGFMTYPFFYQDNLTSSAPQRWNQTIGTMSQTLGNRFVPAPGVIRTWDNPGSHADSVLVVVDSTMNLPLLIKSAQGYTFNQTLATIAHSHASNVIRHHVRPDGSTFHVCDYSANSGQLYHCGTAQGLADNSTWSRGQSWALHGFAELYTLTGNVTYLQTAQRVADYFVTHLPPDGLPYWDFDAPAKPRTTPRDVSAAMAAASGLATLGTINGLSNYTTAATRLLNATYTLSLAQPISFGDAATRAAGANVTLTSALNATGSTGFEAALMHSTDNNRGDNFDTALIYADYYYIEAGNKLLQQQAWPCWASLVASDNATDPTSAGGGGEGRGHKKSGGAPHAAPQSMARYTFFVAMIFVVGIMC